MTKTLQRHESASFWSNLHMDHSTRNILYMTGRLSIFQCASFNSTENKIKYFKVTCKNDWSRSVSSKKYHHYFNVLAILRATINLDEQ